jgi:hypothetical protein
MVTPEGLEDQMLNIVVKIEEPNKVIHTNFRKNKDKKISKSILKTRTNKNKLRTKS